MADSNSILEAGALVVVRLGNNGRLYDGKIKRRRSNNTYDIEYVDGDFHTEVSRDCITVKEPATAASEFSNPTLEVGMAVEVNYKGRGKYNDGKISRVREDGHYDVDYLDGEKETNVSREFIKFRNTRKNARTPLNEESTPSHTSYVGVVVEADWKGRGRYFPGVIINERSDGSFDVDYDDGEKETGVPIGRIRRRFVSSTESTANGASGNNDNELILQVGNAVHVNCRGRGKFYRGRISQVRLDGTCDVQYDDGERETQVPISWIKGCDELVVGVKVECRYKGKSKYYSGAIINARADGTFDIHYDDGETETCVSKDLIRVKAPSMFAAPKEADIVVGAKVEVNYRGRGKYFKGRIIHVYPGAGMYDVHYDDGEQEMRVTRSLIIPLIEEGVKVSADYRGKGKYYKGKISRVRSSSAFDVAFDDGESERDVPRHRIVVTECLIATNNPIPHRGEDLADRAEGALVVGVRVEANYKSKGKFYAGKIARVRLNGTYDIDYDDGEKELGVTKQCIRVIGERADRFWDPVVLEVGALVEANYKGRGKYYRGKISRIRLNGDCDIDYDDGEKETNVPNEYVRLRPPDVGTRVKPNYRARGHEFNLVYDHEEHERIMGSLRIRDLRESTSAGARLHVGVEATEATESLASPAEYHVGDSVEANYRGKGKYYRAKISRVGKNGTYDIDYIDGDKEKDIPSRLIRSLNFRERRGGQISDPEEDLAAARAERNHLMVQLKEVKESRDRAIAERDAAHRLINELDQRPNSASESVENDDDDQANIEIICPFKRYGPHCLIPGIIPRDSSPGLHDLSIDSSMHSYCKALCSMGGGWRDGMPGPLAGFRLASVQAVKHEDTVLSSYLAKQNKMNRLRDARINFDTSTFSAQQLRVLSTLRDQFQERLPGSNPRSINTFYCYQGARAENVHSVVSSGVVSMRSANDAFFGTGCYSTLNVEYAARFARGDFDSVADSIPRTTINNRHPVIMFAASVSMAYPITREADYGRRENVPSGYSDWDGMPLKAGFDCHVVCVNESSGFQAVSKEECQYVEIVIDQEVQMLPIAVLWFEEL